MFNQRGLFVKAKVKIRLESTSQVFFLYSLYLPKLTIVNNVFELIGSTDVQLTLIGLLHKPIRM